MSKGIAEKVRMYVKNMPWFISDVTFDDLKGAIKKLRDCSCDETLKALGDKWCNYFGDGTFTTECSDFWTLPVCFNEMRNLDVNLYRQLEEAKLVMFKGDLNYRSFLFVLKFWPIQEMFQKAMW